VGTLLYWRTPGSDPNNADPSGIVFLEFDAIIGLTPEDVATLTSHPVERGVNVTDHLRLEPTRLSIEAIMSKTPRLSNAPTANQHGRVEAAPLDITIHARPSDGQQTIDLDIPSPPIQPDLAGLVTAGLAALSNALSPPRVTVRDPAQARITQAQARALQHQDEAEPIQSAYEKLLEAMASAALITVTTRDRDIFDLCLTRVSAPRRLTGGTGFELELEQLRVADSETVESPKPAEARGALAKKKGTQTTKEAPEDLQPTILGGLVGAGLGD
jgi:hypothetical protein